MGDLTPAEQAELFTLLELRAARRERNKYDRFFPDETFDLDGETYHSRHLYPRHMEHFAAGADYRERCFLAANRVGKTISGAFEIAAHATGRYKHWWPGRRFKRPTRIWAAGKKNETTRDIVQKELFGDTVMVGGRKTFSGTGLVPADCIGQPTWKQGVADLADTVPVKSIFGGWSIIGLKSYQQGRGAFEGTAQDAIWCDEEPPEDVYGEMLIRTATTNGIVILTFTPLEGVTGTVLKFMPANYSPGTED